LEHHEEPSGHGFPRGLTNREIQPLSGTFILSHQLADNVAKAVNSDNGKMIIKNIVETWDESYNRNNFGRSYIAVKKAFEL
jgi:hypothetical protein